MSKQHLIGQYVSQHEGETISTTELASNVGVTLPTVLTFIKNHPDQFEKVARGRYALRALQVEQPSVQEIHLPESQPEQPNVVTFAAPVTVSQNNGDEVAEVRVAPLVAMQMPDYDPDKW